ncbi:MAG: type II secretion system F family protein [Chromatiales bacterium]|nr:type II secretion system F family protein [Chromatiales bacterium]
MPLFLYRARNGRGEAVKGKIEAPSSDAVASQLINSGITPLEISESAANDDFLAELRARLSSKPPTIDDLILFCRQMYTLNKAGVPITRGITGLQESTKNILLAESLKRILLELESGRELSTAMGQQGDLFSPLMISMVRVGENTGKLDDAFLQLSQYLELERDTRNRVNAALRYPMLVIGAIGIAVAVLNVFVIPAFAGVFSQMGQELPWQTVALITVSDLTVNYWPHILAALAAAIYGFNNYIKTERGKYRWDRAKLSFPIIGSIIKRALLSRFARTFAMAARSGVPLIQTLTVVSRAVDNDFVADKVLSMRNGIERGDSLTRTAIATDLFTPLVLQMLNVGEETGAVDEMMDEVADYYEREVDYELKNISSAIEPILIVAVGILVLILALGIFLPMWEITNIAKR